MWYELIGVVFLMLVFCFFMQILTIKTMVSLLNSVRPDGTKEIKTVKVIERKPKKTKAQLEAEKKAAEGIRKYDIIMENLEAYDGTGIGQKEVE